MKGWTETQWGKILESFMLDLNVRILVYEYKLPKILGEIFSFSFHILDKSFSSWMLVSITTSIVLCPVVDECSA